MARAWLGRGRETPRVSTWGAGGSAPPSSLQGLTGVSLSPPTSWGSLRCGRVPGGGPVPAPLPEPPRGLQLPLSPWLR